MSNHHTLFPWKPPGGGPSGLLLALFLLGLRSPLPAVGQPAPQNMTPNPPPNLLFVLTDDHDTLSGTRVHYGATPADYLTDVIFARAVDFIARAAATPSQPLVI